MPGGMIPRLFILLLSFCNIALCFVHASGALVPSPISRAIHTAPPREVSPRRKCQETFQASSIAALPPQIAEVFTEEVQPLLNPFVVSCMPLFVEVRGVVG